MPARVRALVVGLVLAASLQPGAAQAAGEAVPGDLSTQIQGIVSSALGAAAQPSSGGSETTVEDTVNQAVALAENVAADAASTVSPIYPQSVGGESQPSVGPAPPSNGLAARERQARAAPAQSRRTLHRARPHLAIFGTESRFAEVVKAWNGSSGSAAGASSVGHVQTTRAAARSQRSAVPDWPRRPGPMPPRPDVSSAGQSGGQTSPAPLLFAALAGLLLIFGLRFLPRLLPLLAFRKPRRIVLPSWHPG